MQQARGERCAWRAPARTRARARRSARADRGVRRGHVRRGQRARRQRQQQHERREGQLKEGPPDGMIDEEAARRADDRPLGAIALMVLVEHERPCAAQCRRRAAIRACERRGRPLPTRRRRSTSLRRRSGSDTTATRPRPRGKPTATAPTCAPTSDCADAKISRPGGAPRVQRSGSRCVRPSSQIDGMKRDGGGQPAESRRSNRELSDVVTDACATPSESASASGSRRPMVERGFSTSSSASPPRTASRYSWASSGVTSSGGASTAWIVVPLAAGGSRLLVTLADAPAEALGGRVEQLGPLRAAQVRRKAIVTRPARRRLRREQRDEHHERRHGRQDDAGPRPPFAARRGRRRRRGHAARACGAKGAASRRRSSISAASHPP